METSLDLKLIIRRGQAEDAELLAELGARTFSETFAADNTPENMAAYLANEFALAKQAADLADPHCSFLIAETNAETNESASGGGKRTAVGYALLRSGSAPQAVTGDPPIELVRLYVSRESLGSGIGASLMQACIDEAQQRRHKTIWLGVWENNMRAQAFYRKWNFQAVGTHPFQLGDDRQTDLIMQRSITE